MSTYLASARWPSPPCPLPSPLCLPSSSDPPCPQTVNFLQAQGLRTGCSLCPGNPSLSPRFLWVLSKMPILQENFGSVMPCAPMQNQISFSCCVLMFPVCLFYSVYCDLSFSVRLFDSCGALVHCQLPKAGIRSLL